MSLSSHTKIRLYTTEDRVAVLDIFRKNTPKYFALEEEKDLDMYLNQFAQSYFVWEENGQILGAGGCNKKEHMGVVSWYFVDPAAQGKGIGRALLDHSLQYLRQDASLDRFRVRTSQWADRFFAKAGFQLKRIEKDFWAPGLDLYEMEMPIFAP